MSLWSLSEKKVEISSWSHDFFCHVQIVIQFINVSSNINLEFWLLLINFMVLLFIIFKKNKIPKIQVFQMTFARNYLLNIWT